MRIVTQKEMKDIETAASKCGFHEHLIVENVGLLGSQILERQLEAMKTDVELVFLIGKGNNGADGLALSRHLVRQDRPVRAFLMFDEKEMSNEALAQLAMARSFGVKTMRLSDVEGLEQYFVQTALPKVIVDAVFGTGVRLPLSNFLYDVINFVNENSAYTVALDIPTGVEGDTGLIQGNAIRADLTLAVGLPKLGSYVANGAKLSGEVVPLEVGFPRQLYTERGDKFLLTPDVLRFHPESRNKFADKKIFGHTLVIGGSHGLTGALVMASSAAIKAGAGLVTAATWETQYQEFISRLIPEVMTGYIPNDQAKWGRVIKDLDKYSSIVIGPGLARSTRSRKVVLEILNNFSGPVVLDADAINVLGIKDDQDVFTMRQAPTLMTPHFGEFARFSGLSMEEVQRRPVHHLKEVIDRINCSIVLKGPCTYLGFVNGNVYFNFRPNDGMATGGVGDVLAGLLGGLLAQDTSLAAKKDSLYNQYEHVNQSILLAVYIHTLAGQVAAKQFGVRPMTAMNLIDSLPEAFRILEEGEGQA